MGKLFDLEASGYFYTRLQNPTNDYVAAKIAKLEGGTAAMLTSSGQAANFFALFNICEAGSHIVASSSIYGGTFNLINVTMRKMGIDVTFVDPDASEEEISKAFQRNTRAMFGETIANPALTVLDIEKFARIAHAHNVPLIVDNTFPTPVNCRPIEWGADIVTHSTTKYMDGHAVQGGGVIVDSGKFDFTSGKFPEFTEPDESYHGTIYTKKYPFAPYIIKARMQLMRDFGAYPSGHSGFLLNLGLETLAVRMERYCSNAITVAKYLEKHPKIEHVNYPGLKGNKYHDLAQKYLPKGQSGVMSITIKGGKQPAIKFMDNLQMASNEVHVADIRTCVLHPASATHRQLTDEQLIACGINPGMVRLSVGLENVEDIIADLEKGLTAI
jgi:O-acetylhomoserine (thiol)-lyase